jgi:thymidine kinase
MSYSCNIQLIIGSMYSGKSTELFRRLSRFKAIGQNVLVVNSKDDTRTDNSIKTHNNVKLEAIKTDKLLDLIDSNEYNNSKVIGIDEAQFFGDLYDFVLKVEKTDKIVIISGLDGDYLRQPFGQVLQIIPLCDSVIKLNSLCMDKKDGTLASFTKRINNSSTEQKLVGSQDSYISVSREGYFKK